MAKIPKPIIFLACIHPSQTAIALDGRQEGGRVTFGFDDSQLPLAVKTVLLRERLLRVTVEDLGDMADA